jgi:hypothetical protein
MIKNNHFAVAVVGMLLTCFAAGAQPRGGAPAMPGRVAPMAVSPARGFSPSGGPVSSGAHLARQGTVIHISPNGRVLSNAGSFGNPVNFAGGNAVPGLGFDYPHLAAVGGNFRGNPPSFGRGVHQHRNFTTPLFFGGFPYYSDYSDYSDNQQEQQQQQQQQQPQVIVIQPPAPAPIAPSPETIPEVAQPAAPQAPVRDVGEFILVRRDGRVLFASIFSVTGTQVQYVTPEGIRRSLPLSELDTVATQEMNEARGTTLQFQN